MISFKAVSKNTTEVGPMTLLIRPNRNSPSGGCPDVSSLIYKAAVHSCQHLGLPSFMVTLGVLLDTNVAYPF